MNVDAQLIEHTMNPKNYGTLAGFNAGGIGKNPENGEKDSQELAKFFDFINYYENYHIVLMEDALKYFTKDTNA